MDETIRALDSIGIPAVCVSHRRSGTHLLIDLLRRHFPAFSSRVLPFQNPHRYLYFSLDRLKPDAPLRTNPHEAIRVLSRPRRPTVKTHAAPDLPLIDPRYRQFARAVLDKSVKLHCVRDGRAVMCSLYLYRQDFAIDADCPMSDFLRQEEDGMSRPRAWAAHTRAWMVEPNTHLIRFDHVVRDTQRVINDLAQILAEHPEVATPLLPPHLTTKWAIYLDRIIGRHQSTNIIGRSKGQSPPKWQDVFSREDRAFFEAETEGLLAELGFAADSSWVSA